MPDLDLRTIRERLGLTQTEFAAMLGFSVRAIQSCEQGWRQPSPALERMALLLYMARQQGAEFGRLPCWEVMCCPAEIRETCVAYQTGQGHLCWFLTGNVACARREQLRGWGEKKEMCFGCPFFRFMLTPPSEPESEGSAEAPAEADAA